MCIEEYVGHSATVYLSNIDPPMGSLRGYSHNTFFSFFFFDAIIRCATIAYSLRTLVRVACIIYFLLFSSYKSYSLLS